MIYGFLPISEVLLNIFADGYFFEASYLGEQLPLDTQGQVLVSR